MQFDNVSLFGRTPVILGDFPLQEMHITQLKATLQLFSWWRKTHHKLADGQGWLNKMPISPLERHIFVWDLIIYESMMHMHLLEKVAFFRKLLPYSVIFFTATPKYGIPTSKCPILHYFLFWKVTCHFWKVPTSSWHGSLTDVLDTSGTNAPAALVVEKNSSQDCSCATTIRLWLSCGTGHVAVMELPFL